MAGFPGYHAVVAAVVMTILGGGGTRSCRAEGVHHKVGGDQGWDATTDIAAWSANKVFRVGDNIWFAYSATQDGIVELGSREEFDVCNLSNPIRMYTGGLHKMPLTGEGARYFASSKPDDCKNGLKFHVQVLPLEAQSSAVVTQAVADGPKPSIAVRATPTHLWISLALLCLMGFQKV